MAELNLNEIINFVNGKLIQGDLSSRFKKFCIDSRLIEGGELFFAIKGRRDGHEFVNDAFEKGAKGAIISENVITKYKDRAIVFVSDTLKALQELGKNVVSIYRPKIIGITGSAGKTTVKEFTAEILKSSFEVLKAEKNYNNHLGVPLTLLKLERNHEIAVLEMGMSSRGEIRRLTEIAPPDISVITNINPVHLQFFSSLEEIALAKKEILEGTRQNGVAILNFDDPLVIKISEDFNGEKIYFGLKPGAFVRAENIEFKGFNGIYFDLIYGEQKERVNFKLLSISYLYDLLAALGVAFFMDIKLENIKEIISQLKPASMRGEIIRLKKSITIINDSYNSNPKALEFALKDYSHLPAKRKIAVLGDMLELGKDSPYFHFRAGEKVVDFGYDYLITVGKESEKMLDGALSKGMGNNNLFNFEDSEKAGEFLAEFIKEGDLILIKGSRGIKMEKIIDKLKEIGE
ncbi:UDP-N-acetylmuramoyl-tripeptide--D-alanyl-D-alanine ligase [Candidatus Aminicenantes bacterium AC-335-A11]|nr:UDP-N-acetylmuramoyl-tripeptide--D-alanyl-D-alanine ligase [Candidatus Aminicenantes bacterium AC-708-I09]MCP2618321.1 UDP-N-acetylmuramoyl-tripeptide--D-alanyl-D-alanine ligase [Candidatus Aminicenantes bacterium AC-335-A11]